MSASSYRNRLEAFHDCLNADLIPLDKLRQLCFYGGCPDERGMRSMCWRILLNYLGPNRTEFIKTAEEHRQLYHTFLKSFLEDAIQETPDDGGNGEGIVEDHPLNPKPKSQWRSYFADNEVLMQIDRDSRRIAPDLSFFQMPSLLQDKKWVRLLRYRIQNAQLSSESVSSDRMGLKHVAPGSQSSKTRSLSDDQELNWEVIERILFIFYKLNPGQGYVQGMNEVLAPIFFVFANDPDPTWREHAEPDAFFCFTNLMGEVRDCFIRSLDDSDSGVRGQLFNFSELLRRVDIHVWNVIDQQRIQPQFYAFRWLSLLLSQELPLPELLHIWDVLFSDPKRFRFLLYVCVAMHVLQRDAILGGDFSTNMRLLQNYPSVEAAEILRVAHDLYEQFGPGGGSLTQLPTPRQTLTSESN